MNRSRWKKKAYEELARVMSWSGSEDQPLIFEEPDLKPVGLRPQPEYSFEIGHVYRISPKDIREKAGIDADCIFCYEGKQGKHHCFRELRGGWTRTYTDAQLTEKNIQEDKR